MATMILKEINAVLRLTKGVWTELLRRTVRIAVRVFALAIAVLFACIAFTGIGYGFHRAVQSTEPMRQEAAVISVSDYRVIPQPRLPRIDSPRSAMEQASIGFKGAQEILGEVRRFARSVAHLTA